MPTLDELTGEAVPQNGGGTVSLDELTGVKAAPAEQPSMMDQLGSEIARPFRVMGRELAAGGKAAFAPEYNSANPSSFEKYVTTPGSQLLGAARMLGAPVTAFMVDPAERGIRAVGETLGLPEALTEVLSRTAGLGAGVVAPSSLANAIPRTLQKAGQMLAAPAKAVFETQRTNDMNQGINSLRHALVEGGAAPVDRTTAMAAAEAKRVAAQQELMSATAQLDNITGQIAQRQGIQIVSPFAKSLAAPVTDQQAYSFLKAVKPESMPSVRLNNLQSKAQEIIDRMSGVPKPIQPSKTVATAKALIPEDASQQMVGGTNVNLADLSDLQKQAYAPLLKLIESHNKAGGIALDKLQDFKTAMGTLTQATNSNASGLNRQLYRSFMDDIRETAKTSPAAQQFLIANTRSAQNHAAEDIANAISMHGTQRGSMGELVLKPGALSKAVDKDELLKGLPADKRQRFIDTIEDVFRVNKRVDRAETALKAAQAEAKAAGKPIPRMRDLPEYTKPEYKQGVVAKTMGRMIGASTGMAIGGMSPLPGGVLGGAYIGCLLYTSPSPRD